MERHRSSAWNLDPLKADDPEYQQKMLNSMRKENEPIQVVIGDGQMNLIYYRHSHLLTQLRIYPLILLGVIGLLVGVAYLAFSSARRAEQDRVWTGMARETAHQIGTLELSGRLGSLTPRERCGRHDHGRDGAGCTSARTHGPLFQDRQHPRIKIGRPRRGDHAQRDYLSARTGRKVAVSFNPPRPRNRIRHF